MRIRLPAYHLKWPRMKHEENSLRGIKYAARHRWPMIDLDLLITKDGVVVNTHWDRPLVRDGFRDPLGQIGRDAQVRDLTWVQLSRLVAGRWPRRYHIQRVERVLHECARRGIVAGLEAKDDPRFEQDDVWAQIRAAVDAAGLDARTDVRVWAIRNFPTTDAGLRRVRAARRHGFTAYTILNGEAAK
jgi:glycerophosphoryl diester phosphodiesterase